jgi:hypothetical protein
VRHSLASSRGPLVLQAQQIRYRSSKQVYNDLNPIAQWEAFFGCGSHQARVLNKPLVDAEAVVQVRARVRVHAGAAREP